MLRLLAAALAVCLARPAPGIINLRFTPADLVRLSGQIFLLQVSAPVDGRLRARVVETLKGDAPAGKTLVLDASEAEQLREADVAAAFAGRRTAAGVLLFGKRRRRRSPDTPAGLVQVGLTWFAVYRDGEDLYLDRDERDFVSVWAGSAEMLAEAVRYVRSDPAASFPVTSSIRWGGDLRLGRLGGPASGCLAADLGEPVGRCVLVLSDRGDRVYRAGSDGAPPADVTEQAGLATASRRAVLADMDGDGRVDLASWDGAALDLALRKDDGGLAAPARAAAVPDCRSLAAVDAGDRGAGLVVGTAKEPLLLVREGEAFVLRPLTGRAADGGAPDLGPGGRCVVADVDGDGRCDVLQLFARGMRRYAGQGGGRFKPPAAVEVPLVADPSAAVCGDYDTDGRLDLVVAGRTGFVLLVRGAGGGWRNVTRATGELDFHGNAGRPRILDACPCDINNDGRQGLAFFYPEVNPMVFFNRGFACFGLARELNLSKDSGSLELAGARALAGGQSAGTMLDFSGDTAPDLVAVTPAGDVWVLVGKGEEDARPGLTVSLAPAARGPVTVSVAADGRHTGMYVVRPGRPVCVGRERPGPVRLEWTDASGRVTTQEVTVGVGSRFEIGP
ncbi:MAG: VCBS repeat-containing protein [Phycisphaerae bacterium]